MKSKSIIGIVIVCLILVAAIAGGLGSLVYPTCPEYKEKQCPDCKEYDSIYDVNRDGKLNTEDAIEVIKYLGYPYMKYPCIAYPQLDNCTELKEYKYPCVWNYYANKLYDVNIDGRVDLKDVKDILMNIKED